MSKHAMTNPHAPAPRNAGAQRKPKGKKNRPASEISLAPDAPVAVTSEPTNLAAVDAAAMEPPAAGIPPAAQQPVSPARSMTMADLKLVRSNADRKNKRLVIYNIEGRTGSVQFLSTLFGGDQKSQGNPPETLTLSGEFAEPKAPKAKETPEERKARLAAMPKPTLEEKIRKAEERAAKLREKLAKAAAAPAEGAQASA